MIGSRAELVDWFFAIFASQPLIQTDSHQRSIWARARRLAILASLRAIAALISSKSESNAPVCLDVTAARVRAGAGDEAMLNACPSTLVRIAASQSASAIKSAAARPRFTRLSPRAT